MELEFRTSDGKLFASTKSPEHVKKMLSFLANNLQTYKAETKQFEGDNKEYQCFVSTAPQDISVYKENFWGEKEISMTLWMMTGYYVKVLK